MKRLLGTLAILLLAAPTASAGGVPVLNTILTDRVPPYLFPAAGTPVQVGGSATNSVLLTKTVGDASLISLIGLAPGSDFEITGGTCVQGVTILASPGNSCSIDLRFVPTATGLRTGTLTVDCTPVSAPGGISITCDTDNQTIANLALNGVGAFLASLPAPSAATS
jgi:hypothetical protein